MRKFKNVILCSLCLMIGGIALLNHNEKIEVRNVMKAVDETYPLGNEVCLSENDAKYIAENQGIKAQLTYMYGNVQAKTDSGEAYYCDNPDVDIKKFDICEFDGYYYDAALTKPLGADVKKIGQVEGFGINYIKDSNGCITGIHYVTVLYAKCKDSNTTTTTTTTKKVNSSTTTTRINPSSTTTTKPVSKDDDGDPENPETGDMIWLYACAGIVLIAGCGLTLKKLANK